MALRASADPSIWVECSWRVPALSALDGSFLCFEGLKHWVFCHSDIVGEVKSKTPQGSGEGPVRGVNNQTVRLKRVGRELLSMVMVMVPRGLCCQCFQVGSGALSLL